MTHFNVVLCIVLMICVSAQCDGIDIDLSAYHPGDYGHKTLSETHILSKETIKLDIFNINDDVGFVLVQVHTFLENITLSADSKLLVHSYVTGTNVGLFSANNGSDITFYIIRQIQVAPTVRVLLVITVYDQDDPVPGGCNLTFDTVVAPYQRISYTDDIIKVHSQPPSAFGIPCVKNGIQVDMYHLFLPEYDNTQDTYFNVLAKMITVESIKLNGRKVYAIGGHYKYGRLFSSYRGTGEVFGIIATYKNRSSAYVPAVSYGCNLLNWDTDCVGPVSVHWKILCANLLLFGLFVCFFGHKFFRITLFLSAFTFGVFITYLLISQRFEVTNIGIALVTVGFGILYGLVWILHWWKFGIPLLSVSLSFFLAGTLIASAIFYFGLANFFVFTNDINFWVLFFSIVILSQLLWTMFTMHGHIFACCLLGAYATIVATNYYVGGNLQYIFLNTYRRAAVKDFSFAVIDPPLQSVDSIQLLLWVVLLLFGCYIQLRNQRNRPPFPPNRRRIHTEVVNETTPLLQAIAPPHDIVDVITYNDVSIPENYSHCKYCHHGELN